MPAPLNALMREIFAKTKTQFGADFDHTEAVRRQQAVSKVELK